MQFCCNCNVFLSHLSLINTTRVFEALYLHTTVKEFYNYEKSKTIPVCKSNGMMLQMVWISKEMHNQNKRISVVDTVCIVYYEYSVFMMQSAVVRKCISRYFNYIALGSVHMWDSCRNDIYIQCDSKIGMFKLYSLQWIHIRTLFLSSIRKITYVIMLCYNVPLIHRLNSSAWMLLSWSIGSANTVIRPSYKLLWQFSW